MANSAVAVVVGFTKRPGLLRKSFAPLRSLKRAQVLDRILYVTWDKPELDEWVAEASAMPEVELVRVPEPAASGLAYQKKHFYQTHNIAAALSLVPDDDTLVVKLRPDQIIDANFLAGKISSFDYCCAPSQLAPRFDAAMPRSPFKKKIWIPWADSNQPFFFEDGLFAGLRGDAVKLVTPQADDLVRNHGDEHCPWIVHVARHIVPFLSDYPIFERYMRTFHHFVQQNGYRRIMLNAITNDLFFLHLVIANAWILASNFHVDCGYQDQIVFYPPEGAGEYGAADKPLNTIPSRLPYNNVEGWRLGQKPGHVALSINRLYGRLVDDNWQQAIFSGPLSDLSAESLSQILRNVALHATGVLDEIEDEFYQALSRVYRECPPEDAGNSAAVMSAA